MISRMNWGFDYLIRLAVSRQKIPLDPRFLHHYSKFQYMKKFSIKYFLNMYSNTSE